MPIYEYNCPRCHKDFEAIVMGNKKVVCPHCKCAKPDKKMSTFGMAGSSEKGGSLGSSGSSCSGCSSGSCSTCG